MPTMQAGTVDVWRAEISIDGERLRKLAGTLSDEERARSERLKRGREDFTAARGILREILGRYLGVKGADIVLREEGRFGKPMLAGDFEGALRFNVSHSGRLALYAVCADREVGVDVEEIRSGVEVERIAAQFFSRAETQALRALPQEQRLAGFYHCWTRKEAYVKATGLGLSLPLDSFDVRVDAGEEAWVDVAGEGGARWRVRALAVGEGYAGAVAAQGIDWTLRRWSSEDA